MNAQTKKQIGWWMALVAVAAFGISAARADFAPGRERFVGRGVARTLKNVGFESVRPSNVQVEIYRTDGVKGFSRLSVALERGRLDFFSIEAKAVDCGSVLLTGYSADHRFMIKVLDHSTRSCKDLVEDSWQIHVEEVKNAPYDSIRMLEFGTSIEWLMTTMSTRPQPAAGKRF